nr:hypothetical protein [Tanacetum cinerariifolium]
MNSLREVKSQFKFLTNTLQDFGTMPIFKRTLSQDLNLLEQHLTKEIISKTDCKTILTKLRTIFENAFNSEFKERMQKYTRFDAQSFKDAMICNMDSIGKYMLEIILHQQQTLQLLTQKKLTQTQDHSNPIQALNVNSLKVNLVVIQNTCFEKEDSNSETASSKSVKESSLDFATKDVHAIKYKIFKRAFMSLFGQDADTFTSTMLLNVDRLQKQLNKDEFQEDGSMAAFRVTSTLLNTLESRLNTSEIHYSNTWVMSRSPLLKEHVIKDSMIEGGIESEVQDDCSRSGNDTDADGADIRPIYDEEPMAEVQLTAECNIFTIGQRHTEQPEIINEEHSVAKLRKENETLKKHYKDLYDSIKITRSKAIEQTTSLLANNADLKAQIQEKVFAIAALKNDLRKLKGNSVDTNFGKTSVLGKLVLQSLINQSVVRQLNAFKSERPQMSKPRFASQVDVSNNLSRSVTQHYFPKRRERVFAKPDHMFASSESRNSSKNIPRSSSNTMVHNHYLDEARKKTQEKDRNSKTSVIPSARFQSTADGSKPKPKSTNHSTRSLPVSKSSCVTITAVPKAEHSKRKLFDSCTSKDDSKPTHGLNVYIPNIYESKQTLDLSSGTSINVQKEQETSVEVDSKLIRKMTFEHNDSSLFVNVKKVPTTDMISMTMMIELESLFGPSFDDYFNGENQFVSKPSNVTTADTSDKRQQQPNSTSSTSTLATTVTADGNFDL